MAAPEYGISVDLSGVGLEVAELMKGVFPLVTQAIQAIANEGAARWKSKVLKAPLAQAEKEAYIKTIAWEMTGSFEATISATYAGAELIESGRPAFDQKIYLKTSLKVRVVKKGKHAGQKYLIIPFRHNTPGHDAHAEDMPVHVYAQAIKLKPSRVTGQRKVDNKQGVADSRGKLLKITRSNYMWGGRLPEGLVPKSSQQHKTDRFAGMVRMDTSTKKGGNKTLSSAYLTFRVMGEWSHGWIRKATPGLYLARQVADELRPLAEGALQEAMKQTVLDAKS